MLSYQKVQMNNHGQNTGTEAKLPQFLKFEPQLLLGRWVKLIPFAEIDQDPNIFRALWRTIERETDDRAWTYLPYDRFSTPDQLENALKSKFNFASYSYSYVIQVGHQVLGWISLISPRFEDRVIELGNIYFSEALRNTTSATEAVYMLIEQCFVHGFRKVECRCDDLNEDAVNAAVRLGFLYEGTLRQDRIIKGKNRNTAIFSILDEEWTGLSLAIQDWLKQDNFDVERKQKQSLEIFMQKYPIMGREEEAEES